MKKLLVTLALFVSACGFAQLAYPVDIAVGQRWVGTNEAAWYGSARTYLPTGITLFGIDAFAVPEVGIDYNSLQTYAALELTLDGEYGTFAAWATYMGGVPRINVEFRMCVLSDRCGE